MRIIIVTVFILLIAPKNFTQVIDNPVEGGTLIIRIIGFTSDEGECWFALDNSEDIYESEDSVFIGKILPIENSKVNLTIDSLEYGNYAIRVFHDENSNGELDSNILGIPTEDYGFSNNASAWFGPPRWEKAEFILNQDLMTIEISVD
jgi:uncharacterized protein (DUF2141 family)